MPLLRFDLVEGRPEIGNQEDSRCNPRGAARDSQGAEA